MKQDINTYVERPLSVMEQINKTSIVYLCVDCENYPCLVTPIRKNAERYAKEHFCTISVYPIGTYIEPKPY